MTPADLRALIVRTDRVCVQSRAAGNFSVYADAIAARTRLILELRDRIEEARKPVVRLALFRQPVVVSAPCDVEG